MSVGRVRCRSADCNPKERPLSFAHLVRRQIQLELLNLDAKELQFRVFIHLPTYSTFSAHLFLPLSFLHKASLYRSRTHSQRARNTIICIPVQGGERSVILAPVKAKLHAADALKFSVKTENSIVASGLQENCFLKSKKAQTSITHILFRLRNVSLCCRVVFSPFCHPVGVAQSAVTSCKFHQHRLTSPV